MREILFKAKRVDNGEWVEGNLIRSRHKNNVAIGSLDFPCAMPKLVSPETVSQYTGLKNEDGKKIFEGDIFWVDDERDGELCCEDQSTNMQVVFSVEDAGYYMAEMDGTNQDALECYLDCKIIGNIFDNPELLEVQA